MADMGVVFMSFKSIWGFDPDEVEAARAAFSQWTDPDKISANITEDRAARIPSDICSQVKELRRIFRL
jgi:hypothetical protein